ncbi:MAG TPA: PaaI family thioesterase, partial [Solirubrobacterales bacterium]|nr:PaaI family thioesterase [Solirubrobacterales bacterium]
QLGIAVESLGTDEAVLVLPFKPELATIGEVVHGGAIGALIDTAAMAAAWASDDVPENPAGSTVSLSVNFAAAASGVDLCAQAQVAKRGGRLSFCEVTVTDPEGTVIAHGIATYRFG